MKTTLFCACGAAAVALMAVPSLGQSHAKANAEDGVVLHQGNVFLVRGGTARRIDAALVPAEQMLTREGQLVPIPENVTGLGATGTARIITGANTTATPNRPADATTQDGLVMQGGTVYLVRGGQAKRLDETTVPPGQMLTLSGVLVKAPEGLQGLNESRQVSGGDASSTEKSTTGSGKPRAQK